MTGRAVITYGRAQYPRTDAYLDRQDALTAARRAAAKRLAELHADEFTALWRAEARARGVALPALSKRCGCGGRIARRTFTSKWPASCGQCGDAG